MTLQVNLADVASSFDPALAFEAWVDGRRSGDVHFGLVPRAVLFVHGADPLGLERSEAGEIVDLSWISARWLLFLNWQVVLFI